jgi:ABC-type dipeptide/oligopeptide/nickel transport system permease component
MNPKQMAGYYISRAGVAVAFGVLTGLTSERWWFGLLCAALLMVFFAWAPHSGRYTIQEGRAVAGLQRDERSQAITAKAARNAFVVLAVGVGTLVVYFGAVVGKDVPVALASLVLALGVATYYLSDFILRRR